jgi:hypothetical protein
LILANRPRRYETLLNFFWFLYTKVKLQNLWENLYGNLNGIKNRNHLNMLELI